MTVLREHLDRTLAVALLGVALTPATALAARHTYTAPKFPVPASARVQPLTGGAVVPPTGAAGAPTVKTTVPQTGAVVPGATTPAVPGTTTPTVATTPSSAATSVPNGARKVAPKAKAGSSGLSTPAAVAAAIAALLALGCAIWAIARLQAFEPHWTLSLRHTLAEAGYRASATWAEFGDWARLGR